MPSKRSIRSSNDIINRLIEKDNQLDSENLNNLSRSQLVHKGLQYGVIDETEFQASIPSDNYIVKSYLWSYLDNPSHRERVRHAFVEYALLRLLSLSLNVNLLLNW